MNETLHCSQANLDEANVSTWRAIRCGDPKCGHTFCGRCGQTPHRRDPGAAAATPGKRPELDVSCESFAQSLKAGRDDAVNMEMTRAFLKANGDVTQECPSCHATGTQIAGSVSSKQDQPRKEGAEKMDAFTLTLTRGAS